MADCHTCVKHPNGLEDFQKRFHKQHGVHIVISELFGLSHSLYESERLSIPNIESHYKKLWIFVYLLFPKTAQYHSVYNLFAFQTSSLICQSPDVVQTLRGTLLPYYNTGGSIA